MVEQVYIMRGCPPLYYMRRDGEALNKEHMTMPGRLGRLSYTGADKGDEAYSPRKAGFIAESFPPGSVYYVHAIKWNLVGDGYLTWTVIVVMEVEADVFEWNTICKSVGGQIHLKGVIEVAPLGKEENRLEGWKEGLKASGEGIETGSIAAVEEQIRIVDGER